MKLGRMPIEAVTLFYTLAYIPYMVIARQLATTPAAALGRPLTGLEILPATQILSGLMTLVFVWAAGWLPFAHKARIGGLTLPSPTRWTFLSGLCTGLVLFTVPLSLTFEGVSIPFIQLLMRGDVLIIAPLVDLASGRKVRWWSWAALVLVAIGLFLTIRQRGGLNLPPLAVLTIVLYTAGYFGRLAVMTHVSKDGDPAGVKAYYVEEKLVGIPFAVLMLALIPLAGFGTQAQELHFGFIGVWTSEQIGVIALLAALLFIVSVFAILILLDPRENSFCVPLDRSATIVAGVAAAFLLSWMYGHPPPTGTEIIGAGLMVCAIVILSVGPRLGARKGALHAA